MTETPRTDQRAFKAAFLPPEAIVTADFARELERELAKATAERDEARRKLCEADANHNMIFFDHSINGYATNTPQRVARLRGWDCFAPHANTTDVPVQNGGEA
jgi:hypothetical protein